MAGDITYYKDIHKSFLSALESKGYKNTVKIIKQMPHPDPYSLSNAARKLIALDVDVIVAYGSSAAVAVFHERSGIPLVYSGFYSPDISGKRHKNITGTVSKVSVSSLLRYLRAITPVSRLGVVYSSHEAESVYQAKEMEKLSKQYGFNVLGFNLKSPHDAGRVLKGHPDAIFVTGGSTVNLACPSIINFAMGKRIPTASVLPSAGRYPVVALFAKPDALGKKLADKVIAVLNGTPPGDIKPDSSEETELVFNLKEVVSMGIKIPLELVTEATKIIE